MSTQHLAIETLCVKIHASPDVFRNIWYPELADSRVEFLSWVVSRLRRGSVFEVGPREALCGSVVSHGISVRLTLSTWSTRACPHLVSPRVSSSTPLKDLASPLPSMACSACTKMQWCFRTNLSRFCVPTTTRACTVIPCASLASLNFHRSYCSS